MSSRSVSIKLAPTQGSFPFDTKTLSLTPDAPRITLGVPPPKSHVAPSPRNGLFEPLHGTVLPLTLAVTHAELYLENGKVRTLPLSHHHRSDTPPHPTQVLIRDLDSPFGTFVNTQPIRAPTPLKPGDVITLGKRINRNAKTPRDITDDQLRPISLQVTVLST
ncbi:hypothetical protein K523DRAFT_38695 [Schizophyllum commune Tattone D]|nr:hypothetical protein K523DRAFT_38695 [Schizophyllum commune Tattone D]